MFSQYEEARRKRAHEKRVAREQRLASPAHQKKKDQRQKTGVQVAAELARRLRCRDVRNDAVCIHCWARNHMKCPFHKVVPVTTRNNSS